MPTAVWTGALSFGLVSVPVRLVSATEPKDVRFHLYDEAGRRIRYRRVVDDETRPPAREPDVAEDIDAGRTRGDAAPQTPGLTAAPTHPIEPPQREVAWDELLRGRETDAGELVLLSREEIEQVRPQRSRTIDIEDFVDLRDIDPVYFEKTYYAIPRGLDEVRPYRLLHAAMQRAGRVGIGRFVLRTKPHLVAVRPMDDVLAVETLFFGDEVRDARSLSPILEGVSVDERELDLAQQLIEMLKTEWDPSAYADTYREELLRLLAEKETVAPPGAGEAEAAGGRPSKHLTELMAALRESVEAAKAKQKQPPAKKTRKRAG
jgi:DNA end-binding protein Ku